MCVRNCTVAFMLHRCALKINICTVGKVTDIWLELRAKACSVKHPGVTAIGVDVEQRQASAGYSDSGLKKETASFIRDSGYPNIFPLLLQSRWCCNYNNGRPFMKSEHENLPSSDSVPLGHCCCGKLQCCLWLLPEPCSIYDPQNNPLHTSHFSSPIR